MNIFVLDSEVKNIPKYLVDKHINAQIKEGAQMLSVPFWNYRQDLGQYFYDRNYIYKVSHRHHPCTKWVCRSLENWLWLKELVVETHKERLFRLPGRPNHKSYVLVKNMPIPKFLPSLGITTFPQAMPDEFKHENVVTAYRQYYRVGKSHLHSWKKRGAPEWLNG
jgi:hypothetical protein